MKRVLGIVILTSFASLVQARPVVLNVGEPFIKARTKLYADGWRPDPLAHAASGKYVGTDRQLAHEGYFEVDYCSLGKTSCVFQYKKASMCLRLQTQGEDIPSMTIDHWSNDCREQGAGEEKNMLPADVRYLIQGRNDCDSWGQCDIKNGVLLKLKNKYAQEPAIMKVLSSLDDPREVNQDTGKQRKQ